MQVLRGPGFTLLGNVCFSGGTSQLLPLEGWAFLRLLFPRELPGGFGATEVEEPWGPPCGEEQIYTVQLGGRRWTWGHQVPGFESLPHMARLCGLGQIN